MLTPQDPARTIGHVVWSENCTRYEVHGKTTETSSTRGGLHLPNPKDQIGSSITRRVSWKIKATGEKKLVALELGDGKYKNPFEDWKEVKKGEEYMAYLKKGYFSRAATFYELYGQDASGDWHPVHAPVDCQRYLRENRPPPEPPPVIKSGP